MATEKFWWKFDLSSTNEDTFHEQILKLQQLCYRTEKLISLVMKEIENFVQRT